MPEQSPFTPATFPSVSAEGPYVVLSWLDAIGGSLVRRKLSIPPEEAIAFAADVLAHAARLTATECEMRVMDGNR